MPTALTPDPIRVSLFGDALLDTPQFNKGTAFTSEERKAFQLTSRLPYAVNDLESQLDRAYEQLKGAGSDIKKNTFLWSLKEQNWVLFYALISRHLEELFPIIYTPTEAQAISSFSQLFRKPQGGVYLSYPNSSTLEEDFRSHLVDERGRKRDIELVVISDGEMILGIGDQGSGGIAIAQAKAVIYTLAAGIHPAKILSIGLDVGTNNEDLLNDDLYVGWRNKRIDKIEYYDYVDRVITCIKKELPSGTLVHFEDFGRANAQHLLDTYRDSVAAFNDDVQGTGAVTLAALQSALHVAESSLNESTILIYGAGSAGLGIARQIRTALTHSDEPLSTEDANARFILVDKDGLLTSDDEDIREGLGDFARNDWKDDENGNKTDLRAIVEKYKPTAMIGTSTNAGAFSEDVIREMAKHCSRPIIFPLSNPTNLCECQPQDAMTWTDGKALLATGSPFDKVEKPDGSKVVIGECNNALIYPGIGFGAILAKATSVTDKMIITATKSLASQSPALSDPSASLLAPFADVSAVNLSVALAVLDQAIRDGVAQVGKEVGEMNEEERREWAKGRQWRPEYRTYEFEMEGEGV